MKNKIILTRKRNDGGRMISIDEWRDKGIHSYALYAPFLTVDSEAICIYADTGGQNSPKKGDLIRKISLIGYDYELVEEE